MSSSVSQPEIRVYVGNWSADQTGGIYLHLLNPSTGELTFVSKTPEAGSPFHLTLDHTCSHLYAANTIDSFEDQPGGTVCAFSVNQSNGELTFINQQSAHGNLPCYVSLDKQGKHVLVGSYSSGTLAILPILADGSVGPATDHVQHVGTGFTDRQTAPYVHCIVPDPAGRFAFAADLGIDKVMIYRLDAQPGKLIPNDPPYVSLQPGAGPRHLIFHPNGRFVYLINEIDSTITVYAYIASAGALTPLQTIPTLPSDYTDKNHTADLQIHPNGRFLYGTNRAHNSIVMYDLDPNTGLLTLRERVSSEGEWPWSIAIDPTANFLLSANSQSNRVVVFRIDPATGQLTFTGHGAEVPGAVCVKTVLHKGG